MPIKNGREAAMQALLQMEENEGYSNIVFDKTLRGAGLDHRESALAATLFYGVLEKRLVLDWLLQPFCKKPLGKLDLPVRETLRMAVYQIYFLDRVPDSAAVNEAVNWVKQHGYARASGFVNGLLRSLLRGRDTRVLPSATDTSWQAKSLRYGIPEELLTFWDKNYGHALADRMGDSLSRKAPLFGRVNETRLTVEEFVQRAGQAGIQAHLIPSVPGAVWLEGTGSVGENPLYQQGLFFIQDLSSQLCVRLSGVKAGEKVADVCAAPGGKSFSAAICMHNQGKLRAFDLYRGKVKQIREGAARLGLTILQADVRDAAQDETLQEEFDRVFCDVPCSGYGIIRRKPEIRYKPLKEGRELPGIQAKILDRSAALVRPGGTLMISTCTLVPDENEKSVERFLNRHPDFEPESLEMVPGLVSLRGEPDWRITLMPENAFGGDGFFVARLRRRKITEGIKEKL